MAQPENFEIISPARLKELTEAESILEKLRAFGVDNWEGYGDAMAEWEEENE